MKELKDKRLRKPQPGSERKMNPKPVTDRPEKTYKLQDKIAVITGGDSGIGKAVAILFAKEGADVAIIYLNEHGDATDTKKTIEEIYGRRCLLIDGNIANESFCEIAVEKIVNTFGTIDILVNNAAVHYESDSLEAISTTQLIKTFETNIFSMFWLTKRILPYMKKGSAIINSSSVTAYRGSPKLIDYSATKGAIVAFTRSLSANLAERGIRVNGVAPGPIWTPLIPSSFSPERVAKHGSQVPLQRAGEPAEVAPCYLFLASDDSSYMTGQFLHPNGGEIINT